MIGKCNYGKPCIVGAPYQQLQPLLLSCFGNSYSCSTIFPCCPFSLNFLILSYASVPICVNSSFTLVPSFALTS